MGTCAVNMSRWYTTFLAFSLLMTGGCFFEVPGTSNTDLMTPARLDNGLVIILPGIEGESQLNLDIREGLMLAGVPGAMPIYHWGRPVPVAAPLLNQMDFVGNRLEAQRIAQMIVEYQNGHPGRSVYLVGHSGGGGMAVFAAESLPEGRSVDGLVLLSASLSRGYDLSKALSHTRCGIVNFYSNYDRLLVIGTTLTSNVDGGRGPAAGALGFKRPAHAADSYSRLWQVQLSEVETSSGWAHAATTRSDFVYGCVSPWVLSGNWPAGTAEPYHDVNTEKANGKTTSLQGAGGYHPQVSQ